LDDNIVVDAYAIVEESTLRIVKHRVLAFSQQVPAVRFAACRVRFVETNGTYSCHTIMTMHGRDYPGVGIATNATAALDKSIEALQEQLRSTAWEQR